jgi:hypothetical protein
MRDLEANMNCPGCKRAMRIKVKEMVPGTSNRCPFGCGATIKFSGDDGRKMQRAMDGLEQAIRRLGRH